MKLSLAIGALLSAWVVLLAMTPQQVAVASTEAQVSICHREGNGTSRLISVASPARAAHIAHGDADLSGVWAHVTNPGSAIATLTVTGTQVVGVWLDRARPDFTGVLSRDGCTVDMNFGDDAIYRGTYSASLIQWSYPNDPGSTDPANQWVRPTP